MPTVDMREAEATLSRLVAALESGAETEIVITRNGKAAARLVTFSAQPDVSRRLGVLAHKNYPPLTQEQFDACNDEIADMFYGKNEGGSAPT